MLQNFKSNGYWKLPSSKTWQLYGELQFSTEKGIELNLIGSFENERHDSALKYDVIHGFTSDGKEVTLLNCIGVRSIAIPGLTTVKVYAKYIIRGGLLSSIESIKVGISVVHFTFLDEWIDTHGFKTKPISKKESKPFKTYIRYQQPELIKLLSNKEKDILVWFSVRAPLSITDVKTLSIDQKTYLNIKYHTDSSFEDALADLSKLRNFLAFGLSRIVVPSEIELRTKNVDGKTKKLTLIYQEQNYPNKFDSRIFDYTTLFSFKHLGEKSDQILLNWFAKYETLRPVFDRYFDCIYNPAMFAVNHFLNLTFAIETYHRRTTTSTAFSIQEFESLKKLITTAVSDKKYKTWLNNKFGYANELSLRDRFKSICSEFESILQKFEPDIKGFINRIVHSRNYYVHYDINSKKAAVPESELSEYNITLGIILQLCLLKELGFTHSAMSDAVKRSQYNWGKLRKP